jgi:ubiquinone/menaquinone biosynthesis C-methylase UbiE
MLTARQVERIRAFQDVELQRILDDSAHAARLARMRKHACIADWLPPGGRVLELGCGPGRYVAILAQLGYSVVGVDPFSFPSWALIASRLAVDLREGIRAEQLPFESDSFDHVVCLGALLYFEDDRRALAEIARVIKPGGSLIVRTVNRTNFYTMATGKRLDPASCNLYTMAELVERIAAAGFEVSNSFSYGFWPPFFTDFWWYLVNGWIPERIQYALSAAKPAAKRVNNTVFGVRRASDPR